MNVNDFMLYLALESFNSVSLKAAFKKIFDNGFTIEDFYNKNKLSEILTAHQVEKILKILNKYDEIKLLDVKSELKKKRGRFISYIDDKYPQKLKDIFDPPIGIFCKGNIELLNHPKNIAIVGTRKPTYYGIKSTRKISELLACENINIVSGLATGVDSIAHKASMKVSTIAVLGTGVDVPFPTYNRELYEKIIFNNGLIVSEYPMRTPGAAWNFPQRNRIISALSDGIIVIEGETDSGSLITARFGIKQNKKIFALPGPIDSSLSNGPNVLIKSGVATLLTSINDITLHLYEINKSEDITSGEINQEIKNLTEIQEEIYHLISSSMVTADEIVSEISLPIENVIRDLSILEIKGLIIKTYTGSYRKS